MSRDFDELKAILVRHGAPPDAVTPESTIASLGFDELDWADVAMGVEEELGKDLRNAYLEDDATEMTVAALLTQLQAAPALGSVASLPVATTPPPWMDAIVMWMETATGEARPALLRRCQSLSDGWRQLTPERWETVRRGLLCDALDEAVRHLTVDAWGVRDAVAGVRAAVESGATAAPDAAKKAREAAWQKKDAPDALVAARVAETAETVAIATPETAEARDTEWVVEVATWPARDAARASATATYDTIAKAQTDSADDIAAALLTRLERAVAA